MGNKYFLDSNLLEKLVESLGDLQLINDQIKLKKNENMVDIETVSYTHLTLPTKA